MRPPTLPDLSQSHILDTDLTHAAFRLRFRDPPEASNTARGVGLWTALEPLPPGMRFTGGVAPPTPLFRADKSFCSNHFSPSCAAIRMGQAKFSLPSRLYSPPTLSLLGLHMFSSQLPGSQATQNAWPKVETPKGKAA